MFLDKLFPKIFRNENRNQNQAEIEYTTGNALPIDGVYLSDLEKYPIWIFALDNEGEYDENQDESWLKPITNSTNVTNVLVEAYILLQVKENGCYAFGHLYVQEMVIDDLWYWNIEAENWDQFQRLGLPSPIHLISIPSIMDQVAVEFQVDEAWSNAKKVK